MAIQDGSGRKISFRCSRVRKERGRRAKPGLLRPSEFNPSAGCLFLLRFGLGNVGIRRVVSPKKLFQQGPVAFGGQNPDHQIGGLRGRRGGRFPEPAVSEFEVKLTLPGEDDPEHLNPRRANTRRGGICGVVIRNNPAGLQGGLENPAIAGGEVGRQPDF